MLLLCCRHLFLLVLLNEHLLNFVVECFEWNPKDNICTLSFLNKLHHLPGVECVNLNYLLKILLFFCFFFTLTWSLFFFILKNKKRKELISIFYSIMTYLTSRRPFIFCSYRRKSITIGTSHMMKLSKTIWLIGNNLLSKCILLIMSTNFA